MVFVAHRELAQLQVVMPMLAIKAFVGPLLSRNPILVVGASVAVGLPVVCGVSSILAGAPFVSAVSATLQLFLALVPTAAEERIHRLARAFIGHSVFSPVKFVPSFVAQVFHLISSRT
jgi:hypothetical protein